MGNKLFIYSKTMENHSHSTEPLFAKLGSPDASRAASTRRRSSCRGQAPLTLKIYWWKGFHMVSSVSGFTKDLVLVTYLVTGNIYTAYTHDLWFLLDLFFRCAIWKCCGRLQRSPWKKSATSLACSSASSFAFLDRIKRRQEVLRFRLHLNRRTVFTMF